jgi:hypothetical protein
VKCHRNGFADCMKALCALWMCYSEACGDHVNAELSQDILAERLEAEQRRLEGDNCLKIPIPRVHLDDKIRNL